jgi:hypothetical protein
MALIASSVSQGNVSENIEPCITDESDVLGIESAYVFTESM